MNGGIILLDKPSGMTSFDCDKTVRRVTGIKKVGHSGTLDPFATGLLPVFAGDALKFMRYTDDYDKAYYCRALFGRTSDTGDKDGEITEVRRPGGEDLDKIRSALDEVASRKEQIPPKYSAKKINGIKAYDLARQGVEFTLKPNRIEIYSLDLRDMNVCDEGVEVSFTVHCSKGTYIRTICTDAGELSGFGAYALELRRLKCGPFDVRNAVAPEELEEDLKAGRDVFADPVVTLESMPVTVLSDKHADDIRCGRKIPAKDLCGFDHKDGVLCKAVSSSGALIAVIYQDNGIIRIDRGFA